MLKSICLTVYIIFIHILLITVLVRTDFVPRLMRKIGLIEPELEISQLYKSMLPHQLRMDSHVPPDSIIFIGDSMIQDLCVSAVVDSAVNFGIGGDTTVGLLKRVSSYTSIKTAKLIIICIGTNDLRRRANLEIIRNYKKIISKCLGKATIITTAIFPVDERVVGTGWNQRINSLNKSLKALSDSTESCFFMNPGEKFLDHTNNLDRRYHIGDGKHLNPIGYKIWIDELKKFICQSKAESS